MKPPILKFVVAAFGLIFAFETLTFFRNIPEVGQDSVIVFVHPNLTVREIAQLLKNYQVLEVGWKFRLLSKLMHAQKNMKPGEYRFRQPSTPFEAIRLLTGGKVLLHKVTFPEGTTMTEMAKTLEENHLVIASQLIPRFHDPILLHKIDIPAPTMEGFLFPDTYFFSRLDDEIKIIKTMHDRFLEEITPERLQTAKSLNLNLLQWVTLASIVEKESGVSSEQPIISSVFHNRLKKKMRLQSDPTVIYGIPNYDGNIRKKDLLTPTPYNTYTQYGLPPGPIANPGRTALDATIHPAKSDFLYFVAKNDGTHIFAKTYEEHAKNVRKFQILHATK